MMSTIMKMTCTRVTATQTRLTCTQALYHTIHTRQEEDSTRNKGLRVHTEATVAFVIVLP